MNALKTLAPVAEDDAVAAATRVLAEARNRCVALGLAPQQLAELLLLPEALLALMVAGMRQEEVEEVFANFARDEIPAWFLQVKRTVGYCDCEREARGEHAASCSHRGPPMPVAQHILGNISRNADT